MTEGGAGELALPDPPRLGGAFREAAFDLYYNSWRMVPANIVWGVVFITTLLAAGLFLPAFGLLALLAVPVAGLHRMAAMIERGGGTTFSDFVIGIRRFFWPALATGIVATLLAIVFSANVTLGLQIGGVFGWFLSAFALYGDIGLAMVLVAFWPILVDPLREELPFRRRLWLAALVNLARPGRMFVLTLLIVGVLFVSTVLFAAIVTVAVAYVSLVAARYVLPVADRLEGRRTVQRLA
jgi:hypothetical protein